ncbi:MAG: triphosphoribosyl-dephospho-CoA synthase [Gemmatimonadota bacterium]
MIAGSPGALTPTSGDGSRAWPEAAIARAATRACELEAQAEKPGNVTSAAGFPDMDYGDFLASARALGPVMGRAGRHRVGQTILRAIEATRRVARANTNLGIVLLLTPLARAAAVVRAAPPGAGDADLAEVQGSGESRDGRQATAQRGALRASLLCVLEDLDLADARLAYRAIRLARPGGMGSVPEQDLAEAPTVTLLQAMRLAAARDAVAREYAESYRTTFDVGQPLLEGALAAGLPLPDAAVELYLRLLAQSPDTLLQRKFGAGPAAEVSSRAAAVLAAGDPRTARRVRALRDFDRWLREPARRLNPGTTADLVAAVLFVRILTVGEPGCAGGSGPRVVVAAGGTRS